MKITADNFKLLNETLENKAQLNEALAYLQQSPTATKVLEKMLEKEVAIRFKGGEARYHLEASDTSKADVPVMSRTAGDKGFPANVIDWDPNALVRFTDAQHSDQLHTGPKEADRNVKVQGMLSPTLLLIHEGGHAIDPQYLTRLANKTMRFMEMMPNNLPPKRLKISLPKNWARAYALTTVAHGKCITIRQQLCIQLPVSRTNCCGNKAIKAEQ